MLFALNVRGISASTLSMQCVPCSPYSSTLMGEPCLCSTSSSACRHIPHGAIGSFVNRPPVCAAMAMAVIGSSGLLAPHQNSAVRSAQLPTG